MGRRGTVRGSDVSVERGEIHLPQLLNEEAIADEFSKWEQVSSLAAERFVHRYSPPPARSHTLPGVSLSHSFFFAGCNRYTSALYFSLPVGKNRDVGGAPQTPPTSRLLCHYNKSV